MRACAWDSHRGERGVWQAMTRREVECTACSPVRKSSFLPPITVSAMLCIVSALIRSNSSWSGLAAALVFAAASATALVVEAIEPTLRPAARNLDMALPPAPSCAACGWLPHTAAMVVPAAFATAWAACGASDESGDGVG